MGRFDILGINSATPPNPNSNQAMPLDPFGGVTGGFADGVANLAAKNFYNKRVQPDGFTVAKGMGNTNVPYSIFNRFALFNYRGMYGGLTGDMPFNNYFDKKDNPLMGGHNAHYVSIPKIIDFYSTAYPKISYKASDFLYLKYYKQIPPNHLITLRRFPLPVMDNIFPFNVTSVNNPNEIADTQQAAGVTAVTYLGETAGNKLEDILKFSYGLKWKLIETDMESIQSQQQGYTQQPFYTKAGVLGQSTFDALKGIKAGEKFRRTQYADGQDRFGTTYANFVIGPVNVVNATNVRDRGIDFSNDIKLNFEYELKSLNYVNPKVAMIDIISNMLTMTTNNANFFGGGHRYYGAQGYVASQFGDINKLRNGDFGGYMGSVVNDISNGFSNVFGGGNGNYNKPNTLKGALTLAKTALGNLLGGFLAGNVGALSGVQATKAFVSGEPTGNWHLTVGNPLNPIVMMGNMYCDNATMTLGEGLGYDDFPMEAKFEITVKHGKPRDKGDIENMFNIGKGRIYASVANEKDILNLKGLDPATYGSVKAGNVSIQQSQSAAVQSSAGTGTKTNSKAPASSAKSSQTSNLNSKEPQDLGPKNVVPGTYIDNVISMMIDS